MCAVSDISKFLPEYVLYIFLLKNLFDETCFCEGLVERPAPEQLRGTVVHDVLRHGRVDSDFLALGQNGLQYQGEGC